MITATREQVDATQGGTELRLRRELMSQWLTDHAEHCGALPPWPHEGDCQWPMPTVLSEEASAAYLLLLELSGESVGLHLQSPEG